MTVFDEYSRYYDLLYADKDYAGEAAFVDTLIRERRGGDSARILELGCGTGRHAYELVKRGHTVHGVDLSSTMLERAQEMAAQVETENADSLSFELGDIRTYRTAACFDAAISLFHVMSYQTSNEDLLAAVGTAAAHLSRGGVFVFDCWYGPTVLTERPEYRERVMENDEISVRRIARPSLFAERDVCEVGYRVTVTDKAGGAESVMTEKHAVRYLFTPEVELVLASCGFDLEWSGEFGTGGDLGFDTWNACYVARRR